jgi:hypothetical protein
MSTVSSSYSGLPRTRKKRGRGNNVITSSDGTRILWEDKE